MNRAQLVSMSIEELYSLQQETPYGTFKSYIIEKIIKTKQKVLIMEKRKLEKLHLIEKKNKERKIKQKIINKSTDEKILDDLISENFREESKKPEVLESPNQLFDSKFKGEVKRDHLNNNLTDRLNSDIAIKKFQKKEKKKKEFIRPFDENKKSSYENYFNDLPKDDFSNRRILT